MLDLGDMRQLDIDAETRTAWAETGLTAAEYTTAAMARGYLALYRAIGEAMPCAS